MSATSVPVPSPRSGDPWGAIWRRWDPHIHTPGTVREDEYGSTTLDQFLTKVESVSPTIEALGVTDYYLTRRYEEVLTAKNSGRLSGVGLLFCNIEMRLTIETRTGKGVNLHLLVSPDDTNHVEQLKRFLSQLKFHFAEDNYSCTEDDLRKLGRAYDPTIVDDEVALREGVNQFKVDFQTLRKLYEETAWARNNILIAVAGSSNDGTAGLQDASAQFAATRKEIERFAHVIFTATPKNIEFWRGEGVLSEEELNAKYLGVKPCLHGCDAHKLDKVGKPDEGRLCWIKGDTTFEGLRQAYLEPRRRVHIGLTPPDTETPYSINTVATPDLPWLVPNAVPINPGMVAVIGARGSGKTALVDLIAHAGDSSFPTSGEQSFLMRAKPFLGNGKVIAEWSTPPSPTSTALTQTPDEMPSVHYLTQQFVDRLCSSVGQSDELLEEIKRVVFLAHEPASRMDADNFDTLAQLRSSETLLAVEALNQRLDRLSHEVGEQREWFRLRTSIEHDVVKLKDEINKAEKARQDLIKPGGEQRAGYYTRLGSTISAREQALQRLNVQLSAFGKLQTEARRYESEVFPRTVADLKVAHAGAGLTDVEWASFMPTFAGKPQQLLTEKVNAHRASITKTTHMDGTAPTMQRSQAELDRCSLEALKKEYSQVGEEIGADRKNVQRLKQLNDLHTTHSTKLRRREADLKQAKVSAQRLNEILAERAELYERFFDLVIEQCNILNELYAPLAAHLADQVSSAQKLSLRVVRDVDVNRWARIGEDLLDLRKIGEFRGRGVLAETARTELLPAWRDGSAADVAAAMESFRAAHDQSFLDQSDVDPNTNEYQQWILDLGRWLYSTDHVRVHYSIEYEGVPISQLSPGTRGIVLLLLYLALDLEDSRPLIIDQPEENLDPKSVFSELVDLFREARLRRQVIIVTHNANLVVNTDVDQVIVASCVKPGAGSPPKFEYACGGLEDPEIRSQVCDILEGGETAFKQRAKRLRVAIGG